MLKTISTEKSTEFSALLKEYINKSGITVYKLAQITGLGRTSIQHSMSGALLPTRNFLDTLVSALRLTPNQYRALYEAYKKEKLGTKDYYNNIYIKNMIEKITDYCIPNLPSNITPNIYDNRIQTNTIISGTTNVLNSLKRLIALSLKETVSSINTIISTLPFECSLISDDTLLLLESNPKKYILKHFIMFSTENNTHVSNNISLLCSIFKVAACLGNNYIPYAYYSDSETTENEITGFPYTLVTHSYAIIISSSFNNAIIFTDEGIIKYFYKKMDEIESFSNLVIDIPDTRGMFDLFFNNTMILNQSIEYQPSFTQHFSMGLISKYLPTSSERDFIIKKCEFLCSCTQEYQVSTNNNVKCVYFSEEGLTDFALNGFLSSVPGDLLTQINIQDRIVLLQKIKSDIGNYMKMINPIHLKVSPNFSVLSLKNNSVIISYISRNNKFVCILKETGLCIALQKYIESLGEPDYCYSTEYTLSVIDKLIYKLSATLKE